MASSTILSFLLFALLLALSRAVTFEIVNGCPFTVWAAAVPGGGRQLDQGQTWVLNVNPGTTGGRIWARTGCSFNGSGSGSCQTGDCGGLLKCEAYGSPPNTLAEFALNQFNNIDFFDVSLVDGFNVPMEFGSCRAIRCSADINGRCPAVLRTPGGCKIHARCSRRTSTAAHPAAAGRPITPSSSRAAAPTPTATRRTTPPRPSLAPAAAATRLSSAPPVRRCRPTSTPRGSAG